MSPDDINMEGWFPERLFGQPCYREAWPGSIFAELRGAIDGPVPAL